jgi:hypothetical protein
LQIFRGVAQQYPNLFGGGVAESGEASEEQQTSGRTFEEKWGWIGVINNMANNDRSKWDFYFDLNVIEFLNTVVFYKDKSEEEKRQWQKAKEQR